MEDANIRIYGLVHLKLLFFLPLIKNDANFLRVIEK